MQRICIAHSVTIKGAICDSKLRIKAVPECAATSESHAFSEHSRGAAFPGAFRRASSNSKDLMWIFRDLATIRRAVQWTATQRFRAFGVHVKIRPNQPGYKSACTGLTLHRTGPSCRVGVHQSRFQSKSDVSEDD